MLSSHFVDKGRFMCDVICADIGYYLHSVLWLTGASHFHLHASAGIPCCLLGWLTSYSRLCLHAFSDCRDIDAVEFLSVHIKLAGCCPQIGQEGPMVHIGGAIASELTWMHGQLNPTKKLNGDKVRPPQTWQEQLSRLRPKAWVFVSEDNELILVHMCSVHWYLFSIFFNVV
jgi:hypothetical protein